MPDVYTGEDAKWVRKALKAGVPVGQIEFILLISKLHDKKPQEVQDMWMDAHVGVQQQFRKIDEVVEGE